MVTVLALLPVLLTGCTSDSDQRAADQQGRRSGLLARSTDPTSTTDLGPVGGRLAFDDASGCISVAGRAVVWPAGTVVGPGDGQVTLASGTILSPGDEVSGGGAEYLSAGDLDVRPHGWLAASGDEDVARACLRRGPQVLVFGRCVTREQASPNAVATTPDAATPPSVPDERGFSPPDPMRLGDSGRRVRQLQYVLVALGLLERSQVDGHFGPRTQRAVEAFQQSAGLPRTGIVNGRALRALNRAIREAGG